MLTDNPPAGLPNISAALFQAPTRAAFDHVPVSSNRPRILLLYGSLRQRSYSRFLTLEAQRLLEAFGCETRVYHADGLPLPDGAAAEHPKSPSFARSRNGPRARSGAPRSATARLAA